MKHDAPLVRRHARQNQIKHGVAWLRDLPDLERLEDAGLLTKDRLLAEEIPVGPGDEGEGDAEEANPTA